MSKSSETICLFNFYCPVIYFIDNGALLLCDTVFHNVIYFTIKYNTYLYQYHNIIIALMLEYCNPQA